MNCKYCGKPIEDNSRFCPHCGKDLLAVNVDNPNIPLEKAKSNSGGSVNAVKLILSFVLGTVLSFLTAILLIYVSFTWLIIAIVLWVALFALIRQIATSMTGSNGIGVLGGLIGGFALMWIVTTLLSRYVEEIDGASSMFQVFLMVLPLTLVYTFIIYAMAYAADMKKENDIPNIEPSASTSDEPTISNKE